MQLAPLENEKKQQEFDRNWKRQREEESSGGVWHDAYVRKEDVEMKHLRQKKERQSRSKKMQEIFHTKNAYGEISLGMNEEGETALVAEREHYKDGPTVENNARELNEENSYRWRQKAGFSMINVKNPADSAFGIQSPEYKKVKEDRETVMYAKALVEQSQMFAQKTGQHNAKTMFSGRLMEIGDTKTWDTRSLRLSHQLSIAMEEGKKRILRKHSEDIFPIYSIPEKFEQLQDDAEDAPEDEKPLRQ